MKTRMHARMLAIVMVAVMVFGFVGMIPMKASAAAPATYTDIYEGDTKYVSLSAGSVRYFRFVPAYSGAYTFKSSSASGDPKAYLLDSNGSQLTSDDDGAGSLNFQITYNCSAGVTYYLKAAIYNSGAGSYNVTVSGSGASISVGETKSVTIATSGAYQLFRFVPTQSGSYTFQSSDVSDAYGALLDSSKNTLISNDDGGPGNRDFQFSYNCTAGSVYYLKASMYSDYTGSYSVWVTGPAGYTPTPTEPTPTEPTPTEPTPTEPAGDRVEIEAGTSEYYLFNSGRTTSSGYDAILETNPAPHTYNNNGYDLHGNIDTAAQRRFRLGLSFTVNTTVSEQAELRIRAYDVDEDYRDCGYGYEYDFVDLVDETTSTSVRLSGHLSGQNNTWNNSTFRIDPSLLQTGHTYHFEVYMTCTGSHICQYYEVVVRTVSLSVSGLGGEVETGIENASLSASASSSGLISATLNANAYQSGNYTLEYKAVHAASGDQKGGKEYTVTIPTTNTAFDTTFQLESGFRSGTYTVTVYIKDGSGNVVATRETTVSVDGVAVAYDANGGTQNLPVDLTDYVSGDTVTVLFNYIPSRTGYVFQGWARNATAARAEFTEAGTKTFTIGDEDVTLYAVWRAEAVEPTGGAHSEYNASTGDVFLGGNYIELGISRHGSFGTSTRPTTPGFHCGSNKLGMIVDGDGWDVGNAPTTGDFFLPDTPEERYIFAYKYSGTTYQYIVADRNGVYSGSWRVQPSVSDQSSGDMLRAVVTGVTTHGVELRITYSFHVNDKFYRTDVEVINNSSNNITDVRFVRSFDPDQDDDIYDTNNTYNKVICNPVSTAPASDSNYAMVVARGERTLEGFFFIAFDNRARATQGVDFAPSSAYLSGLWFETHSYPTYATDAAIAMSPSNRNGYTVADTGIAVTFNLGTIAASGTETAQYYSSMSPTVEDSLEEILEPVAPVVESISGAELEHGYTTGGPSVTVTLAENHEATYQWYRNTSNTNSGGTLIPDATDASYNVPLAHEVNETEYYYCVITATRTDNGLSASTTSDAVAVAYLDGVHTWNESDRTEPRCGIAGEVQYVCAYCPAGRTEVLPALPHAPGEWIVDREPTCTESGLKHTDCTVCGARIEDVYMPPLGHNYSSVVIREVTCELPGIIRYTCLNCGDWYDEYIYAEHNYVISAFVPATCESDGYTTYTCTVCGDSYNEIIPGGHDYVAEITKIATAEQDGEITYTCSICGHFYIEVIPARPNSRVLLIQDRLPWSENNNVSLLNKMVEDGYLVGWDMTTTTRFDPADLAGYGVVMIANDQTTATYSQLRAMQDALVQFANAGGVVIYGACDNGWAGGNINHTLPQGTTKDNFYSHYNYIVDADHPIVTGVNTDGKALTNTLLYGNYCSHTAFFNLPADANVILQDGHGDPTLVEFAMGDGHMILSGLTWEFYYVREAYNGYSDTTYTKNVYDDLVFYALQLSDSCDHAYDVGEVVDPTCTEGGYTLHTCQLCGGHMKDNATDPLGHIEGEWEVRTEATAEQTGLKVLPCDRCGEVLAEEVIPMLDAPIVSLISQTDPVILGQTFEVYVVVADCDPIKAAAFVPEYDESIFELVSAQWLKEAMIQVTQPQITSAWMNPTDVNGNLLKLTFRAKALTSGSMITSQAMIQNGGLITLSVVGDTVAVIECPHAEVTTSMLDAAYHTNVCTVCGFATASAHSFDHACDTTCNECEYEREITHTEGEQVFDAENHWYECAVCGEVLNVDAHSFDHACDTTCNECAYERTITHTPGTVSFNDQYHWNNCAVCGAVMNLHGHTFDHTCDTTCNLCDYVREITHTPGEQAFDEENHWNVCTVCGELLNVTAHSFDHGCDTTCNECEYVREITHIPGVQFFDDENHWRECMICGEVLNVTAHSFDHACDTTCNECAYTRIITHTPDGQWVCDEDCHWQLCAVCGEVVETSTHEYDGNADSVCNICDYVRVVQGDMTGDNSINSDDAVYLLLFTFFPEEYPLNQGGDYDGNGIVNSDDAVYLLLFTFFPDEYPLHNLD